LHLTWGSFSSWKPLLDLSFADALTPPLSMWNWILFYFSLFEVCNPIADVLLMDNGAPRWQQLEIFEYFGD
jgi:hypothetical protein